MLAVGAGYAFAQSRYAYLGQVTATGVTRVPPQEVVSASGLQVGQSLFSLRPRAVVERVKAIPWVREARLHWAWPNGAIIAVSERTPLALIPHHDRFLVVDGEGRVLTTTEEVSSWALPLVTGSSPAEITAGEFIRDQGVLEALRCVAAFPPAWLPRVAEVHAEPGELVVYDLQGLPGLVGAGDAYLGDKIRNLCAIWEDIQKRGAQAVYVDVRCRDRPIVKLAEGGGEKP